MCVCTEWKVCVADFRLVYWHTSSVFSRMYALKARDKLHKREKEYDKEKAKGAESRAREVPLWTDITEERENN